MVDSERERWNHNNHYHDLLLRRLGTGCQRVLDVGCGHGFFAAKLAQVADHVDAVDLDPDVVADAAVLHPCERIEFRHGDFLNLGLPTGHYDAVTSIASFHHMDLRAALREAERLLRPDGRLVVLDLYREESLADYAASALAIPADRLRKAWDSRRSTGRGMSAPICAPSLSLREVRTAVAEVLPGAFVSRRLYWRYLLVWEKAHPVPAGSR